MNKNKILLFIFGVIAFSALVYAAFLISEEEVLTCSDTDGGVVVNVTGTISGQKLAPNFPDHTKTDLCVNCTKMGRKV